MDVKSILKNNLILSPLAGYTDAGMRLLCSQYGASLTVTEMVSAMSLAMGNRIACDLLRCDSLERPRAVQLFGSKPSSFVGAIETGLLDDFDVLDINMGCPMPKITRNGEGSALMGDMQKAYDVVHAVRTNWKKPLSVKFRSGIYDDCLAVDFAKMLQDAGVDMLVLHARTARQMYAGKADWRVIERVSEAVSIPVIGNGDVVCRQDYLDMLSQTGCYGVAVGRASLGAPYLFSQILSIPYTYDTFGAICKHYDTLSFLPQKVLVCEMRKHLPHYLKGMRDCKKEIVRLYTLNTVEEVLAELRSFCLASQMI